MKINISEYGLDESLGIAENYLRSALNTKNKHEKDQKICCALGSIQAMKEIFLLNDDEQDVASQVES